MSQDHFCIHTLVSCLLWTFPLFALFIDTVVNWKIQQEWSSINKSVKSFSNGIRNLGLWNLELGWRILNPAIDWNESGIQILLTKNPVQEPIRSCPDPVPGIRNPQLGIQSPSSTDKDWNPVPGIRNPQRGIENPRLSWVTLHRAISVSLLMHVLVPGGFRSFLIQ